MSNIITSILTIIGISSAPTTVAEFMWTTIVLVVGLYVIKYCMIFITSLFQQMLKIGLPGKLALVNLSYGGMV